MSGEATNGEKGPSCARCKYAVKTQVVEPSGEMVIGEYQLNCKRFPPQVVMTLIQDAHGNRGPLFPPSVTFPPVTDEVWCYEFKEGEPQDDTMGPFEPANDSVISGEQ